MPRKKDRIIIDTNLWISFLLTYDLSKLDKIFESDTSPYVVAVGSLDKKTPT